MRGWGKVRARVSVLIRVMVRNRSMVRDRIGFGLGLKKQSALG